MTRFTTRLELSALEGREVPSVVPTLAVLKKPDLPAVAPITFTVAAPADQVRGVVAAGKVMNQSLAAFPAQKATPAVAQPGAAALDPGARITPAPQSPGATVGGVTVGPKGSLQQQMFGLAAPASSSNPLTLTPTAKPTAGSPSALTASTDAFKAWSHANGESRAVSRTDMLSDGETATTDAEKTTGQKVWEAAGSILSFASGLASEIVDSKLVTTAAKGASAIAGVFTSFLTAPGAVQDATGRPADVMDGANTVGGYKECKERELATSGAKPLAECLEERKKAYQEQVKNSSRPDPNGDAIIRGGAATIGTFGGVTIRGHLTQPVPGETVWMKIAPSAGRGLIADSMAAGQGTKINPARGDGGVVAGGPAAPRDGVDCPPEKQGNGVGTPGRPAA